MREILFKAKRIDNGEWVVGSYVYTFNEDKVCPVVGVMKENYWIVEKDGNIVLVDKDTICQYTGLTDKNGNKIWENDVVKQSFYIFLENEIKSEEISGCEIGVVVIIPTKGTCMKNPLQYVEVNGEIEKNFEKTKMYKGVCQYRCEVIGNIFDNADLLKGE